MTLFKTVRNRTKAQAAGRKLADRFAPSQTSYAATAAGKNLAIIDGRTVRAAGVDVATGTPISVVNAGSPGMASYSANGAGLAVQYAGGGGTGSGGGMEEHDLSSVWHTGTIADAQAPQFLKTDGSRQITGDLTVAAGIKIDGIDISAHAANPDAHHATATAVAPLAVSGQQVSLTLGHGVESSSSALRVKLPTNSGLARDTTGIYLAPSSLAVDSANAVSGSSHTHAITSSSNPGAAAAILATASDGSLTLSGAGADLLADDRVRQAYLGM